MLSSIPEFSHFGKLFKSSAPVELTEAETEYSVNVVKHIFDGHVVFQFNCTNTISEQLLENEGESLGQTTASDMGDADSDSNEIRRFELLRHELIELEKRVQKCSQQSENEDIAGSESIVTYPKAAGGGLVQKKESFIGKSIDKMKEAGTDVWRGTQLLAIDTSTAMGLLQRTLTGDELTVKESKALRRTITDLASMVPIGILMLLPVTAVGHAAMLAAIKRYVPRITINLYIFFFPLYVFKWCCS